VGSDGFGYTSLTLTNPTTAGARLARSAHDILMSGSTSVRDLGGYAPEISKVIDEGTIPGPNIYSAGSALSQTAGHGDTFELPIGFVWSRCGIGYGTGNGDDVACRPLCVADGVGGCCKAVRLMIRRGAKVIKVLASGRVLSRDDDPKFQKFSDEELKVIVEEAARMNRIVAVHVHGKAGIMAAIKVGCKTLEHGTYLDEEAVELILEKDVILSRQG
jgi:imidazolonepropionase-like amidohydrolase